MCLKMKKLLSLLLAAAMLMTFMPFYAFAEGEDPDPDPVSEPEPAADPDSNSDEDAVVVGNTKNREVYEEGKVWDGNEGTVKSAITMEVAPITELDVDVPIAITFRIDGDRKLHIPENVKIQSRSQTPLDVAIRAEVGDNGEDSNLTLIGMNDFTKDQWDNLGMAATKSNFAIKVNSVAPAALVDVLDDEDNVVGKEFQKAVQKDEEGNDVLDDDGKPVYVVQKDEEGNDVLDDKGNPVYAEGTEEHEYELLSADVAGHDLGMLRYYSGGDPSEIELKFNANYGKAWGNVNDVNLAINLVFELTTPT